MKKYQLNDIYQTSLWAICLHILLGITTAYVSQIILFWGILPLFLGLYLILKNKNSHNEAAIWSGYIVGFEVLLRMSKSGYPWEFGKYAVILLLIVGLFIETRQGRPSVWGIVMMFFLLIPAIFQTLTLPISEPLEYISANASGIVCLLISLIYFYRRPLSFSVYKKILSYMILPIISISFFLLIKTPKLATVQFTSSANFVTSGGFGPNQVATILGLCWLLLLILNLYKSSFSKLIYLDILLFGFVLYRSLFTFSRGGNIASFLALIGFIIVHIYYKNKKIVGLKNLCVLVFMICIAGLLINVLNSQTDGIFEYRYTGKNTFGDSKEDITSNRLSILEEEIDIFSSHIWGTGFGGSSYIRQTENGELVASHNEFGRLLSENGIFGLIIIMFLCYLPIYEFFHNRGVDSQGFLIVFVIIAFSTMMHSAIRISLPAFVYGLGMALIYLKKDNKL